MNNPLKCAFTMTDYSTEPLPCNICLHDFLEHLNAPLVGIVPYVERKAFVQEAHTHIEGLICEYTWQGQNSHEATENALREFGEPWQIGHAFLEEWLQGTRFQRPAILMRKATWVAFASFGTASMMTLLLIERHIFMASQDIFLPMISLLSFFAPLFAGVFVGATSPIQAERGVQNAMLILILHTAITGCLLQPRWEGLILAGWQWIFWLPAGRVSAGLTAAYLRQVRRQRFWQVVR